MQRYNSSERLFETHDLDSDLSGESSIYISSDESSDMSDGWDSDCSTDTEQLIERIEREVHASTVLIGGRIMTVEDEEGEMVAGSSTTRLPNRDTNLKLGQEYFDKNCGMPKKENALQRIQLCKTIIPVADSPMSSPLTRGALRWIPTSIRLGTRASEPAIIYRTQDPTRT